MATGGVTFRRGSQRWRGEGSGLLKARPDGGGPLRAASAGPRPTAASLAAPGKGERCADPQAGPGCRSLSAAGAGEDSGQPRVGLAGASAGTAKPCSDVSGARWSRVCWASPPAPERSPQNVRFGLLSVAVIWRVCVSGQDTSGRFPLREQAEATAACWDGEQRSSVRMPGADKDYFPF